MDKIKPVRIQRNRQHKQVSPNGLPIVYVGRPSKWGNIYRVGNPVVKRKYWKPVEVETAEMAVACYGAWMQYLLQGRNNFLNGLKEELRGRNLSCWCKIGEPCHADILLEMANS